MYLTEFADGKASIVQEYGGNAERDLDGASVLIGWYGYGNYEGESFVLYEKDGKLFEVNGAHCSCNGLEGQWEPEETSWAALAMVAYRGSKFGRYFDGEAEVDAELKRLLTEHGFPPPDEATK